MKEITTKNNYKINIKKVAEQNATNKDQPCSFWDTYYVVSTGVSRSVAEASLQDDMGLDADIQGCDLIGGNDSSCLWDNHGCVATQGYCCN